MPVKRLFVDCTHTYFVGHNTGIQRGVRALARFGPASARAENIECHALVWTLWGFIRIHHMTANGVRLFRWGFHRQDALFQRLRWWKHRLRHMIRGRPTPPLPPQPPDPSPRMIRIHKATYLLLSALSLPPWYALTRRVRFKPGDAIVLADASWNQPMWKSLRRARSRGARVGMLVHDWIPVLHPEWFDPPLARRFVRWLDDAIAESQFFVGVSRATHEDVLRVLKQKNRALPGSWFHWGADQRLSENTGTGAPKLEAIFTEWPVFLVVGTLEPRKNHTLVLDAFEQLWKQDAHASLLIVGRPGWECGGILHRIRQHPHFGTRLFFRDDLGDEELDYCYAHARALLVPSLAEGFGLPIVEALARGLPVLCSDIPVFREIGGRYCLYAPLHDPAAWATAITAMAANAELARQLEAQKFVWPTWPESCQELFRAVKRVVGEIERDPAEAQHSPMSRAPADFINTAEHKVLNG